MILALLGAAHAFTVAPQRAALEVGTRVTLTRSKSDPPFRKGLRCVLGRVGQFSLVLPQKDFKAGGVKVDAGEAVVSADGGSAACDLPRVATAGNTTVCLGNASACAGTSLPYASPWAAGFIEHYAAVAPSFTRRPYVRETEGGLVLDFDTSLLGRALRVRAALGATVLVDEELRPSTTRRIVAFPLKDLPASVYAAATIDVSAGAEVYSHERVFARAPPPTTHAVVTQVDHERRALLRDGVPFALAGWFAGGYGHESAGLPAATYGADAADLAMLGQASLVAEWGRQGQTFVRAMKFTNISQGLRFLDEARRSGVAVLFNVEADKLARGLASIPDTHTGVVPNATAVWANVSAAIDAYKGHPAVAGWYACDDCCHMSDLDAYGPVEYAALAAIKERIFARDPHHVMFGTVACGETWYWSEAGAGLGIDVIMKEAYGGGMSTMAAYRQFPMTHAPLVNMPMPALLGAGAAVRAHAYLGAMTAGMYHVCFYNYAPQTMFKSAENYAVSRYAAEASALLPSFAASTGDGDLFRADAGGALDPSTGRPVVIYGRYYEESKDCGHLIIVNAAEIPAAFSAAFVANASKATKATRLFDGAYDVALASTKSGVVLKDLIDARQAKVYRIGCAPPAPRAGNLVAHGDLEDIFDDSDPGHFDVFHPKDTSYHCHFDAATDDRCVVRPSTAAPYRGRFAAGVSLGGPRASMNVPLTTAAALNATYVFSYAVRSSPAGIAVDVAGAEVLSATCASSAATAEWRRCAATVAFPKGGALEDWHEASPLFLAFASSAPGGGVVYLDDLDLRAAAR